MAMTIGEANAAQTVIQFVTSLTLWETAPDLEYPAAERVVTALGDLAERSSKVLGAGMRRQETEEAAWTALMSERPVETVQVTGGVL